MSSHDTLSPTGGVTVGHSVESANPDENLLERIPSRENLLQAWKRVKANKGADGVDGMSIEAFPAYARDHWDEIRDALYAGIYQPSPVRREEIPKATGGTRPLGVPTVLDRLIQQAAVGEHPLPGSGSVVSVNRPVRTRMPGGVEAGGENPPAIRFAVLSFVVSPHSNDFDYSLFFKHLINQSVVNVDSTRDSSSQVSNQLLKRRRVLVRVFPKDVQ